MKLATYEQWKKAGLQVIKGAKAVGMHPDSGLALFAEYQVTAVDPPDWDGQTELYGYMEEANL